MKKCFSILFLLILSVQLKAQTWDEWFKQKKTQRKYLLNQIVRLQVYLGHVKKGYNILNTGLTAIGSIKKGEFQLHDLFISDKRRVKPIIRNSFAVLETVRIATQVRQSWSYIKESLSNTSLSPDEKAYILNVKFNLLESLSMDIQHLLNVITSGELEMSDHERIEGIAVIHQNVQNKKAATNAANNSLRVLVNQKNKRNHDIQQLQDLFLFPNQP
ncbi:hypothetical protein [Pseudoflavitalea rhizosphaerae]|uniref:hypothetical protein n=1 Tax=Pseudoflavitalea rhizosphaerae TaxID=1884793 RepID=UPI000F8F567D|nr:hypothetical protein [Pseudoflavitalea rhizosphaerae]